MEGITITRDPGLAKRAASSRQGRQFYTGGILNDALAHMNENPNDVCMVRHGSMKVLLGGPIPHGTAIDVSDESFAFTGDSFDVGQMTNMTREWFKNKLDVEVSVFILESGQVIPVGRNSKLISLSRQTPGLLDMAATEDGHTIGQYNSSSLGHSGDKNSTIGSVSCLHHEIRIQPTNNSDTKLFFLVGYNSLPLKAWRDSRVFWIVFDPDTSSAWLVPHNLSEDAVGETVSASMALASKADSDGTARVVHLARPIQATLSSASPLRDSTPHREYLDRCMEVAGTIEWTTQLPSSSVDQVREENSNVADPDAQKFSKVPTEHCRTVGLFDGCNDAIFTDFPTKTIPSLGDSISGMQGPLKVLSRGCCANSRVVLMDASQTSATSDVNLVSSHLAGVIFVKTNNPDIFKLNKVRWNSARSSKTPVIAITPEGCKFLCGQLPPSIEIEDFPTPTAGVTISDEVTKTLIDFALSIAGDAYFGPLYQPIPDTELATEKVAEFIDSAKTKDFITIVDENAPTTKESFNDDDFRLLMETINVIDVSKATAIERNHLAIRLVKFLKRATKRVVDAAIENDETIKQGLSGLELLQEWTGDNVDWAVTKKDVLEPLLKDSSVIIAPQEGVIDLALQMKITAAIQKKKKELGTYITTKKKGYANGYKKSFNRVFFPALEALLRSIGENPRYQTFFREVKQANMNGIVIVASQSTNKQSILSSPEDVMRVFHRLGASGFMQFTVNFFHSWKSKVIDELCIVDAPGCGINDPDSYVPPSHRIEEGPSDPAGAYETDIRNQFILPVFARLPKTINDNEDDESDEEDFDSLKEMPCPLPQDDLSEYLLLRSEFVLRDPEQGTRHPLWLYCDWLFHQIKTVHGIVEKQAAPLAIRALAFSILGTIKAQPKPGKKTMEAVASIIHAINFMSARGTPQPHSIIDTFFNMGQSYVPQTKEMERSPWQIEVVNIMSRAVDYVRPIMTWEEYAQIRCNFQRGASNVVKRQIVQKLLDHLQEEKKKNAVPYYAGYNELVNSEFYPAYREIVETIAMLIEADPETFQLTDDLVQRINFLYHTVAVKWAERMRRCRIGPVRELVSALKKFSEKGGEAMAYLVSRKPYLTRLYDQVYHIKYESLDHAVVEEVCKIIRAKSRNPEHEKHTAWLARVDRALDEVAQYDEKMSAVAHGNQYKSLPTELMLAMLRSLKGAPGSDDAVTFSQIQELLAHVKIVVRKKSDLFVQSGSTASEKNSIFEQLRGEWWMCAGPAHEADREAVNNNELLPNVPLISLGDDTTSNILSVLGDTYHKFELARLFSGNLATMRGFIRENYKFHLDWFEDTIRAAGLPRIPDPSFETLAIYAVVQRLVCELVEDGADRGDRARARVYGDVVEPHALDASEDNVVSTTED